MNTQYLHLEQVVERTGGSKSALFVLQLMAWRVLDDKRRLASRLSFERLIATGGSRIKLYSLLGSFAEEFPWFQIDENVLDQLSKSDIALIIGAVRGTDTSLISCELVVRLLGRGRNKQTGLYFSPFTSGLIVALAEIATSDSVLCFHDNSVFLAFRAAEFSSDVTVLGLTEGETKLTQLFNVLLNREVKVIDMQPKPGEKFDIVMSAPGDDVDIINELYIAIPISRKRIVTAVPMSFLFTRNADAAGLRKEMVEDHYLAGVLSLPPKARVDSEGGAVIRMDFNSNHAGVAFASASDLDLEDQDTISAILSGFRRPTKNHAHVRWVTDDDIRRSGYNLSPNRYLAERSQPNLGSFLRSKTPRRALGELADLLRPPTIQQSEDVTHGGDSLYEVSVSDVGEDGIVAWPPKKTIIVGKNEKPLTNAQLLWRGDILICIKGAVGRVGYVDEDGNGPDAAKGMVAGASFVIVRIDHSLIMDSIVLFHFLNSSIGQGLFQTYMSRGAGSFLTMKDLRKFPIAIPTDDRQRKIVRAHKRIVDYSLQIDELRASRERIRTDLEGFFIDS